MKIRSVTIHNFRSILDASFEAPEYLLMVGANNAGKSTVINALRAVYGDLKWTSGDFPRLPTTDNDSWVELTFVLEDEEWDGLADKYKNRPRKNSLCIRKYFKSDEKDRAKSGQSNIYAVVDGKIEDEFFYGAKNVSGAKIGSIIYVPALSTTAEQTKMSGPSPLRNIMNLLLKRVVVSSSAYEGVVKAFEEFNAEARQKSGFLSALSDPINEAISSWDIRADLSIANIEPEDITKSLIKLAFVDPALKGGGLDLSLYGHGFQRTIIYELIRIAPTFQETKKPKKKDFDPDFTLILFEEPEAFLHPAQQENMAIQLRRLSSEVGQQVFVTSHSPVFAGKASDDIGKIARVQRNNGVSEVSKPNSGEVDQIFSQGADFQKALQSFVDDVNVEDSNKKEARRLLTNPPSAEIASQHERFRYQLWLDSERAAMFFADRVLLVEGATERALFNYLLANDWSDLIDKRICIVDVMGKYNFHRYMAILSSFRIPYGVILDDDDDANHHQAVNEMILANQSDVTLSTPQMLEGCLETFLGLSLPGRNDMKPVEILKAVTEDRIERARLEELRHRFEEALAISHTPMDTIASEHI